jgi:hypothetical protein
VVRQNKEARDERMSDDLIAIGDDGSGDKLCFKKINGKMEGTEKPSVLVKLKYHN